MEDTRCARTSRSSCRFGRARLRTHSYMFLGTLGAHRTSKIAANQQRGSAAAIDQPFEERRMKKVTIANLLCAGALALSPALSHAVVGITDPVGDILTTFAGQGPSNDLDVLDATVLYDSSTNL